MTLTVCSSLKNGRYANKWHLRARLRLFFAATCRKWYLASLLLGQNGAWSRLGRVDMDADEALQMFFDEEDANTFHCAIFWLRSAWERRRHDVKLTDDWAGYPSSPDEETAISDEENLYGGSGQPSADGEMVLLLSSTACVDYNSEYGQLYFTRTSWNLIVWVLWSLSFQNIWYLLSTKVNGCRVICTYSRGSQKWPFLPNYSGPIRVKTTVEKKFYIFFCQIVMDFDIFSHKSIN